MIQELQNLHQASSFINTIEKNNSFKIGCIEEIAFNLHLIDKDQLLKILNNMQDSNYKKYLQELCNEFKKNILVTGGAGFIGSNLLTYFIPKYPNYNFIIIDILSYAYVMTT